MPSTTLGVVFLPQLPVERLREVSIAADEAGLDELWLWEDCFLASGIATASAALAWTQRLRVCVGVLPVPLRNVALTAMEIAALQRLFGSRVGIGVGHGVQDWMGQVGARVASPVTLLTEYLDALRALLRGEKLDVQGRYVQMDGVQLDRPPTAPTPVFAGATGPRTLRLAGAHADGVILTGGTTPAKVRENVALVREGEAEGREAGAEGREARAEGREARAEGREGGAEGRVIVYVHAATGPDAAARLETERRRWGYESMDDLAASGDAATVAESVQRWVEAGADTVVLQPTPDDPDPEGFIRFVAGEVQPLLRS